MVRMKGVTEGVERNGVLPSGDNVTLSFMQYTQPTEFLFEDTDSQHLSLQQLICNSIMLSPEDMRRDLCANIVLCGGNTTFPGLLERLSTELELLNIGYPITLVHASSSSTNVQNLIPWCSGSKFITTDFASDR